MSESLFNKGGNAGKASSGGANSSTAKSISSGANKAGSQTSTSAFGTKSTASVGGSGIKKDRRVPANTYSLNDSQSGIYQKAWGRPGVNVKLQGTYTDDQGRERKAYTATRDNNAMLGDYYGRLNNYFESGNINLNDTRAFRNEAQINMAQAYNPDDAKTWQDIMDYLDWSVYTDYQDQLNRLKSSMEGYNTNLTNATNEYRSTQDLLAMQTDSLNPEYKALFGKNESAKGRMDTAQAQLDRAKARQVELEDELSAYFMDRETWEARQRLKEMNLSRDNYREIVMSEHPEFAASPDAVEEAIDQLQEADQARIDAHMASIGAETRLYNDRDKFTEAIGRYSANRIAEIAGAAATVAKAMDEHITVNGDPILGLSGPPEKKTKLGEAVELLDNVSQKSTIYAGDAYRKITRDMSKLGKGAFDLADQTAEMAWDIGAGYLLGVDPKFIMGERVFGSEGTKASMEGATGSQAFKYAITKAGIEYASESLFGAFDKFTRGKGLQVTQDMTERIIKALADTPAGRTTLRVFLNGGEEQLEEFFSAMLSPLADKIYKDESFNELFQQNMEDIGYSMLMAGILGSLGGAANIAENRRANMELYQGELAEDILARENIREQVDNAPLASVKDIMDNGKGAKLEAEETKQAKLAEQEKKDSSITKAIRKFRDGEPLNRSEASMLFAAGLINSEQRSALIQAGKQYQRINKTNAENGDRRVPIISNAFAEGVGQNVAQEAPLESEMRLTNDELEYNQTNAPESAVMAPQSASESGGTDITPTPTETVKPIEELAGEERITTEAKTLPPVESRSAELTELINRLSYSSADEIVPLVSLAKSDFDSLAKAYNELTGMELPKTGYESALRQLSEDYSSQAIDEAADGLMADNEPLPSKRTNGTITGQERSDFDEFGDEIEDPSIGRMDGQSGVPGRSSDGEGTSPQKGIDGEGSTTQLEKDGAKPVKESLWTAGVKKLADRFFENGLSKLTMHDRANYTGNYAKGFSLRNYPKDGIFGSYNAGLNTGKRSMGRKPEGLGQLLTHEFAHNTFTEKGFEECRDVIESAYDAIGLSLEDRNAIRDRLIWARGYKEFKSGYSKADWQKLSREDRLKIIDGLEESTKNKVYEALYNELACDIVGNRENFAFGDYFPFLRDTVLQDFVDRKVFSPEFVNGLDADIAAADAETNTIFDNLPEPAQANIEETPESVSDMEALEDSVEQRPVPPGTKRTHQNAEEGRQVKGAQAEHEARMKDLAEKYGIDDGTFLSLKREDVSRIANYWIEKYGMQEEWSRLMAEKNWSRVDFSEAGKIVYEMTMQLNRDMAAEGNKGLGPVLEKKPGESYEEYRERQKQSDKDAYLARREPIDALLQMYAQQKSDAGQKLQEQHKFTVADEIRMRASQRFLSYSEDGEIRNASDAAKNAKMWNIVDDLLIRAEKADSSGDVQAMADLSRMVARIRGRERLLGRMGVSGEHRMLNDLIKYGFDTDAIADLMYGGINKIMDDLTPMTYADAIQTIRMTNMLSNIATGVNNFKNNAVALRLGAIAQNAAYPFAKVFENITGKKVAFTDSSFLRIGKGKGRAEIAAMEYALLSSYYGLNFENGRFDPNSTSGTDFYLHGAGMSGVVGRALARYNFLVNAFVLNPDAPAKARANLAMKQGIEKAFDGVEMTPEMARNKKELEAYADVETKRRVLQDDNGVTNAVMWAKNQLNKAQTPGGEVKIGGRRLGNLKLGDFAMAFARVPANVGYQKAMATPFGATYQMLRYAYGLAEAKAHPETMETIKMAKLSRDIGRAATTWGMVGLGALGAMCGALKNFDDTDDDEEKKLAAEKGYKGLTFNVSALLRGGGEWQNDDIVVSGNFLEILAMPLSIGAIMYDAKQENENMGFLENAWYGTKESFGQMVDAVMDIPGLQQAAQLYESFANQSPNDKAFNRAVKAIGQFAANSSTSYFMPNLVSQVTAGVDNKQRDVYKTDSYGESLLNIIKSKIPGLRQTIPEKTDSLGNTRTYGDTQAMSIINTVFLPGDIKRYHISELEKEMLRLKKATGYSGTIFDTSAPKKLEVGENAYALNADQQRAYHETAAKYLVQAYDAFRTSEEYKHLSDSQRLDVIKNLRLDAGRRIKNEALELAGVEDRMTMDKWETELKTTEDKIAYLSAKAKQDQLYYRGENNVLLPRDYKLIDRFVQEEYPKLTDQQKELLDGSYPDYDKLYDGWKSANITAEDYYKIRAAVKKWDNVAKDKTNEETYTRAQRNLMVDLEQMFKNEPNKLGWAIEENRIWQTIPASSSTIENLRAKTGLSYEKIDTFRDLLESQPVWEGYKNMPDNQVYSIIHDSNMPDNEKWLFFEAVASDSAIKNVRKAQAENSDKSFDAAIENAVGWEPTKFSRYKPYSYLENKKAE